MNEFSEGVLVGYDYGEWGGGLVWHTRGGEVRQRVLDENVIRLVPFGNGFLAFTGIHHLVTDEGWATLLEFREGEWKVRHSADLTGMPRAFLAESSGAFLIATSQRIVRLSEGRRVEVLYGSKGRSTFPNSIVLDDDGALYLGTSPVVVRLRPGAAGYTETWLVPPAFVPR